MRRLAALLALFLAACAGPARWDSDHVPYLLDADLSDECAEAAIAAYDFWRDRSVTYIYMGVVPHSVASRKIEGSITVTQADLPPNKNGECNRRKWAGRMHYARVRLDSCDARTATHELGHALGLDHHPDSDNVMFSHSKGWGQMAVTEDQLDWVRP